MDLSWVLVFCLALLGGWFLGFRLHRIENTNNKINLPRDYLVGLNYLLNEEPDKAVDVFIKMLEVDSDTVETHLAVGKLFRRRGEVDRAIRIHQNLIARPHLDKHYREQSLFELGQDYLSAGVLDRAERIFLELVSVKELNSAALKALLDIYQQEKSWSNAIEVANQMEVITRKNMQPIIAHYYCELAEMALTKNLKDDAKKAIFEAFKADPQSVRASLLHAEVEMANNDPESALKSLNQIEHQNPDYLSEVIEPLAACYEILQNEKKLIEHLIALLEKYPHVPVVLILSERIRQWKGDKVAANFVADYVRRYPSLRGLHLFINLYLSNTEGRAKDDLLILQGLTKKLLADKPDYQCVSCGFSGKSLHWQCPGCKQWSSVRPLHCLN